MPLNNLEESLTAMDDAFAKAPADTDPYALPEPGVYQAMVRQIEFFERKNPPNDAFLKIKFEIVHDAKYEGRGVDLVHPLELHLTDAKYEDIERKLSFLKKDLKTLGLPVEDDNFSLAEIRPGAPMWDDVLDVPVELAIVDSKKINDQTGKPYRNLYLNQRLGAPISDVPTTAPATVPAGRSGDGEIPF
jgi:hypothetical protein